MEEKQVTRLEPHFKYVDTGQYLTAICQILKDGKSPSEIPALFPPNLALHINKTAAADMGVEIKESEWTDAQYIE